MGEVIEFPMDVRYEQMIMDAMRRALLRLIDAGFDEDTAHALLDAALEVAMDEEEEWTPLEAIHFYDSLNAVEDDGLMTIDIDFEGANDNVPH